jgi:spore germination protein KB
MLGTTVITRGARDSGANVWLAVLAAALAAVPLLLLYARLCALYPGKNLFDMLSAAFGRVGGRALSLLLGLYLLAAAAAHLRVFTGFVAVTSLPFTPQWVPAAAVALCCAWAARKGTANTARCAGVFLPVVAAVSAVSTLLMLGGLNARNLLPLWTVPPERMAGDALSWLGLPFTEVFFCLTFLGDLRPDAKPRRVLLGGFALGAGLLLLELLRDLAALGGPAYAALLFPSYAASGAIDARDFLQRADTLVAASFLLTVAVKLCVLLAAAASGLAAGFRRADGTRLLFPLGALIALASLLPAEVAALKTLLDISFWVTLPVQAGLPCILWLTAEIRAKRKRTTRVTNQENA